MVTVLMFTINKPTWDTNINKGYTLVEVLITVGIFLILIIPIGIAIQQSLEANVRAKKNLDVAEIMNKAVEEIIYENALSNGSFTVDVYTVVYEIDPNYKRSQITGIQNTDVDFSLSVNSSNVIISSVVNPSVNDNIALSSDVNKIKIKVAHDIATKKSFYKIYKNDSLVKSFTIDNSALGAEFTTTDNSAIVYFIIDGVYEGNSFTFGTNLIEKMFNFWYISTSSTVKFAALSPFISFDKGTRVNKTLEDEYVKKILIKVYDDKGNLIKSDNFYYSYRVK